MYDKRNFTDFGKHKKKKLTDQKGYCKWILSVYFDEEFKEFIRSVLLKKIIINVKSIPIPFFKS